MLSTYGLDMASAIRAAGVFQLGAVIGTLVLGWLIDRHGYFIVLATVYFGAFACSILIVSFGLARTPILVVAFFAGICVSGGQNTVNALSGGFYPTLARSTGAGWGLGIGRIGAVIGIPLSGLLLRMGWTVPTIFTLIGVAGFLRRRLDPADEPSGGALAGDRERPRARAGPTRCRAVQWASIRELIAANVERECQRGAEP
jgi:AAHS family 4-hydroxybenzoate transporter-like MFS transporter